MNMLIGGHVVNIDDKVGHRFVLRILDDVDDTGEDIGRILEALMKDFTDMPDDSLSTWLEHLK